MKRIIVLACLVGSMTYGAEYWPALLVNPTNGAIVSPTTNLVFNGSITATSVSGSNAVTDAKYSSTVLGSEGFRFIGALGGYMLEEFMEDTGTRGLARDLPIFTYTPNSLDITWVGGDVYDPLNGYYKLNSGSVTLVDNAVNYAYWQSDDPLLVKWTTGSRPSAKTSIHLATVSVSLGRILSFSPAEPSGDKLLMDDAAQADVMPSLIIQGMNVYATGTGLTNIMVSSGTEYHDLSERVDHAPFNMNTSNLLVMYTMTNGVWAGISTNLFPIGVWNNGTNYVACDPTKFYRGVFVALSDSHLTWIVPTYEYADLAEATAGADPVLPTGFDPYIPITTAYVFKGDDVALRTDGSYWLDRRFMIRRGTLGTGGGSGASPTLQQVLSSGRGTGGILMDGMGYPSVDDQAASKGYVDSVRNKASTGTAFVDPVNGDDITGRIEKSSLPFKTIQAAIDACAVVATSNRRFLISCSVGSYTETVTMKDYISIRGNDIESTIVNGQVIFPSTMNDVTGCEVALMTVISSNKPAITVSLGSDDSYSALRSCALYSYWTIDDPVKSVIQISRGDFEVYGTTWTELNVLNANGGVGVSCIYYGTTNSSNAGSYKITDYIGSQFARVSDTNDTVSIAYSDANTESILNVLSCKSRINVNESANHINQIKLGYMKGAIGSVDLKGCISTINLHETNNCSVIVGASENSPSYTAGYGVHVSTTRIRAPNLNGGRAYIGSATTTNDYVETFYTALAPQTSVYPTRYTTDGSAGTVGYVLAHGQGDMLIGGGVDLSADNPSSVLPLAGHGRLYLQTNSGFERPYFLDSRGNSVRIGRDTVWTVYNAEATTLRRGELVYLTQGLYAGSTTYAKRAMATNVTTCAFGFVSDVNDIPAGVRGMIVRLAGRIESGVDTSTYAQNDKLYLSSTVAGAYTNVAPNETGIEQWVGRVQTVGTNGSILIEIHDPDTLGGLVPSSYARSDIDTVRTNLIALNLSAITTTNFSSASAYNAPNIIRGRLYVADTGAIPFSKTATLTFNSSTPTSGTEIWQADVLLSAVLTSGALSIGSTNVVVADGTDFSANCLVYLGGVTPEFVRIKAVSGNNLIFKYPVTAGHDASSLCSRVREFGGFKTYDSTASKTIWNSLEFATSTTVNLKFDLEYAQ